MSEEWFAVMSKGPRTTVLGQGRAGDFPKRVRESLRRTLDGRWTRFWVVWRRNGKYRLVSYRARKEGRKTVVLCSTVGEESAAALSPKFRGE